MKQLVPNLLINENLAIEKLRELPLLGKILVKVGDKVKEKDIVAKTELPGDLHVVRLAEKLGVNAEYLVGKVSLKEGDDLERGEVLYEQKSLFGLFAKQVKSPIKGKIEFISEKLAHVGIRGVSLPLEVNAYISGEVVEVKESKSVLIKTNASIIQGIFGVGGETHGNIRVLDVARDKELSVDDIPTDSKGCILIGGCLPAVEALEKAEKVGVSALVTASIDEQTLKKYIKKDLGIALTGDEDVPFTLIITEGFGKLSMSKKHFDIFSKLNNNHASVNGATQVRAGALRPEVIISNTALDKKDEKLIKEVEIGSLIKIIRYPYFGEHAQILELPKEPQQLNSGAYTRVVKVKLSSGEEATIPRANIEM